MTDPVLRLEMEGSREFVITMPGTSYQVTFRQLADGPGLSASHNIRRDDRGAPITGRSFLPALGESPMTRRASWAGSCRGQFRRGDERPHAVCHRRPVGELASSAKRR